MVRRCWGPTRGRRLWCALLGEAGSGGGEKPACVMLRHVSVVHMDTHMIRRQGYDKYYFSGKTNVNAMRNE